MTEVEALMWRLGERDARLRSTMTLVVVFDRSLDRPALYRRVESVTTRVPLLRRRVAAPLLEMLPPSWEPDPDFSVDHHVKLARPGGDPGGPDHSRSGGPDSEGKGGPDRSSNGSMPVTGAQALIDRRAEGAEGSTRATTKMRALAVAEDLIARPFPPGRPPWRAVLVPGPPDALVLHLHHSYTDGLGGVQLIGELFDLDRHGTGSEPPPETEATPDQPGPRGTRLGRELEGELRRSARLAGAALPWAVRSLAEAGTRPGSILDRASEVLAAARSEAAAVTGPPSPVLRSRSASVRLAALEVPLDDLRRTGAELDATVTDVFLGGLLEGLARYHEKFAVLPGSLRLGLPMSARPANTADPDLERQLHNQVHATVLSGPMGPLDFDERVRLIHEMVRLARRQPWLGLTEDLAGLGLRIPGVVGLVARAASFLDVVASSVIGPPFPLYLDGARVEQLIPVGPRSGSALNTTLLSYEGTAYLGLNIDPAAVAAPEVLMDCVGSAFDDSLHH